MLDSGGGCWGPFFHIEALLAESTYQIEGLDVNIWDVGGGNAVNIFGTHGQDAYYAYYVHDPT
jgi:hypothetical protein